MAAETSSNTQDTQEEELIPESDIKHYLQSSWTLHTAAPKGRHADWQTKPVYTFDCVEDFWRLWHNITPGSAMVLGSDYFLFREGINPDWVDKHNAKGGRFMILLKRSEPNVKEKIDKYWLWSALALIGESIPDSELVNGINLSIRKAEFRLGIWTSDASNTLANDAIAARFQELLEIPPTTPKFPYEVFEKGSK